MIRVLILATALALLVPPGPEGVILGALFTTALFAGTALAGTFAASAIVFTLNVIVASAVSFAINAVVSAVAGKPKAPKVKPFGVQGTLRTGSDVPRSIILGRGMTAGSLVWANTWDDEASPTPNQFLTQVIALSDMPIAGITQLFVNGAPVTFESLASVNATSHNDSPGTPVLAYRRDGIDHLWLKVYTGGQTTADPLLTTRASSTDRPWQSTRVGVGVAYAIVTCRFNRDLFNGVPQFRFECDGIALYDPSQDTSIGGSGAHRWDTPATWVGDARRNAGVILYNLLRGVRYGGEWVMGLQGVSAAQLPSATWIAAINAGKAAGFDAGGEVTLDTELGDTVEALLASTEGRLADNAGTGYSLSVGAPGSAVASITDDTIISTEQQSFTPFPGLASTVNGVIFSYPRPSQAWQVTQAPPIYDTALEAEDGGRRLPVVIDMPMVSSDEQAQRLAKAALAEARRARRHTITLPPEYWALEPGDVISWTSERNGYTTKLFRVDGIVDLPGLDVLVDITEVDPSDYDWDSDVDFQPVADGFLAPVRPPVQSTSVTVEPFTLTDGVNARRPAIRINWTNAPRDALAIEWQVRLATGAVVVGEGRADAVGGTSGATIVSAGLVPATGYQVRAKWVPGTVRPVEWSSWLSVTTADIRLNGDDIQDGILNTAKFAAGIEPVGIVASAPLPTVKSTEVIFYAPDDKLYRWNGSAYVASVATSDLTGTIATAQIADAAVSLAKFASGTRPVEVVSAMPTTGNTAGRVVFLTTDGKLYRHTGSPSGSAGFTAVVPAADVTGQLSDAQIAAVAAAKLTGTITGPQIANGAVTDAKIAGVAAAKVTGQITGTQITDGAVSAPKIAAGAVVAGKIAADAITATEIAAGAVTAGKIAAGAVETAKLAAGAVTADAIAANAVTAAKINAGAVEAAKIAANAVTADKVAANAIIAGKIAAGAVEADKIAANAVTAGKIAAEAVTASKLVVSDLANLWHDYDHIDDAAMLPSLGWSYGGSTTPQRGIRQINAPANAAVVNVYSPWRTIEPGVDYFAEASCGCTNGTAQVVVQLGTRDSAGVVTYTRQITVASRTNAASARQSAAFTTSADERAFRLRYLRNAGGSAQAVFGGFMLRRRANGSLIVDGAITAAKVAAGAIEADKIAAGAVTAGKIAAGAVSATEIAADAVTAEKIGAGQVTAEKIQVASLDAISANLGSIQVGSANIADTIQSNNFASGQNGAGWRIQLNGDAEFGTLALRSESFVAVRSATAVAFNVTQDTLTTVLSLIMPAPLRNVAVQATIRADVTSTGNPPLLRLQLTSAGGPVIFQDFLQVGVYRAILPQWYFADPATGAVSLTLLCQRNVNNATIQAVDIQAVQVRS